MTPDRQPGPAAQLRRIDGACLEYEAAWRDGKSPRAEAYLEAAGAADRSGLLSELLRLDVYYRARAGEPPDIDEYLGRFPSDGPAVREAFAGLDTAADGAQPTDPEETITRPAKGAVAEPGGPPELPGYEVVEPLGEGGMGRVYKARDDNLGGREVALKVMKSDAAADPTARARFLREAASMAKVSHANVIEVYHFGEHDDVPFIVMPLLRGEPLDKRLTRQGRLPAGEAARIGAEVADGLAAAHAVGLVHRDVKPSNVWLEGGTGRVKLLDFGLARSVLPGESELTSASSVVGTVAYMSPEQVAAAELDARSDLFSLGTLLYRAATGRLPFSGDVAVDTLYAIRKDEPRPPAAAAPDVPAWLSRVIMRLLAKRPADRPRSAAEAARMLRSSADGDTAVLPAEEPRRRRRPVWAWAFGVAAVAAVAAMAIAWKPWRGPAAAEGDGGKARRAAVAAAEAEPLRVATLEVRHIANVKGEGEDRGRIGEDSVWAQWNDAVKVKVELNEPAYFYLMALNFEGTVQPVWPPKGERPPKRQKLIYPKEKEFRLNDPADAGGMQAFAVAASRDPLPPYEEWEKIAGKPTWRRVRPMGGVWEFDGEETVIVRRSAERKRGQEKKALLARPPLDELCESLRKHGVQVTRAVTFPVLK